MLPQGRAGGCPRSTARSFADGGSRIRSATSAVQPVWCGRAEARAVVAVEVLVEGQVVLPGRIGPGAARCRRRPGGGRRRPAARSRRAGRRGPARSRRSVRSCARARRVLELEVVAEEALVDDELADRQVVDRHPDRPAPVRVAAEHASSSTRPARSRSRRRDALERVRVVLVALRDRARARAARGTPPRRRTPRACAGGRPGSITESEHAVRSSPSLAHAADHAPARLLVQLSRSARERACRASLAASTACGGRPTAGSTGIRPEIVCTFTWADSPDGYTSRS